MSEQAPYTAAKLHYVAQGALPGMPNADWAFCHGTEEKHAHSSFENFVSATVNVRTQEAIEVLAVCLHHKEN